MLMPPGWQNPIHVPPGQIQYGVDPNMLLPSRCDLEQDRLNNQIVLRRTNTARLTPIQVGIDGVIWDGHHAVRIATENGETVDVQVVAWSDPWSGLTILQLPVR
jgi:hypothetical protein